MTLLEQILLGLLLLSNYLWYEFFTVLRDTLKEHLGRGQTNE